jgi:8-oxo-dGTP pyrophosphatase MutT (NUDIX family)
LVVAAVRELFEETGVLLAGPAGPSAAAAPLADPVRQGLIEHRITLASALAGAGLRLRADLLRPWANWITPPGRTRRYDTFFFAAALPPGQQAEMLTTEADLGQWRTPRELFDERAAGTTALMPPTVAMLTDLAGYDSVAQVLAAERVVVPVRVRAGDFPGVG